MTRIAYLDCPSGIAGDMCLGALLDAGVPQSAIEQGLRGLGLDGEFTLAVERAPKQGQMATRVRVQLTHGHDHHHRGLPTIEAMIRVAGLSPGAEARSLAIFRELAAAEAAVHGLPIEQVHFHEVGAVDALVDIVGTAIGLDWLGIETLHCSALPSGGGTVRAAHGLLPVPAPAVLQLCVRRQVPLYSNGIEKELVTPTGAAIACALACSFGPPPALTLERIGLGAGGWDLPIPNLLRLWVGEAAAEPELETVAVLETQIDDGDGQRLAYACEQLLAAGARDCFSQPVTMKKGRLGQLLTVICDPTQIAALEEILFRETPTIGIRRQLQQRRALPRTLERVTTDWGDVVLKVSGDPAAPRQVQPEYEDCAAIARQHGLPLEQVRQAALRAWAKRQSERDGDRGT